MNFKLIAITFLLYLVACSKNDTKSISMNDKNSFAKITSVSISGNINNYTFNVGIESPDKGCDQYANWWEVITEDGTLLYRRVLAHSHVNEQPFIRSGGPVKINETQKIYIRAHMNTSGYGIQAYSGSISEGFIEFELEENFAKNLESASPLPNGCAF